MCVDYRRLNSVTKLDAFPMPTIDSILGSLHGARVFSSLNLRSGYWQMGVAPAKTAFVCDEGLFQFLVLPFGVVNGPASFQRLMSSVLGNLIGQTCYVYLDHIVIYSTDLNQHLVDLIRKVLLKLQDAGLTINLEKCTFAQHEMHYLVSQNGVKPNPEKVSSILAYPEPTTVKLLERFLGMAAWFHKFISNYVTIAEPLHKLHRKKVNWEWTPECQSSFAQLKLTTDPILAFPNHSQPFEIHTDASNVGLGAMLLQSQGSVKHVVAYASRSLNDAERNYSAKEKECLAVV